jgi:alpha-L-fucosidase
MGGIQTSNIGGSLTVPAGSSTTYTITGTSGLDAASSLPFVLPLPKIEQVKWQRVELSAFFHFGINTFTDLEWGSGTESPSLFQPTELNVKQWVTTVKEAGILRAILVVKHHDGFCLWPSKFSEHSVKNSPWKSGQGDVVAEFTEAAHAAGIQVGIYLSPWDRHESTFGTKAYNTFYKNQLTELLTNYGRIDEVWFDNAGSENQDYDWSGFYELIYRLQPNALIAVQGPDIRWVGNEDGIAPIGETSVQSVGGIPTWYPSESDVSIRPGWFYHQSENNLLKPLDQLLDIYFKSVGRNSTLLLNIPPDSRGLLADADISRLKELSVAIRESFATNLSLGKTIHASGIYRQMPSFAPEMAVDDRLDTYWAADDGSSSGRIEIDLGTPLEFNLISLREPIELGERTTSFRVEAELTGQWKTIATGSTIGQRTILGLNAITAQKIALVVVSSRGIPALAELGIYKTPHFSTFASSSLLSHKAVIASVVHPAGTVYGGDKAIDDDQNTRWATPDGTKSAYLEVDLGQSEALGKMEIYEFEPRIAKFQLQYRVTSSDPWSVAFSGSSAGKAYKTTFPSVTARYVRLNISDAVDSPTIWEFRVFAP